MKPGIIIGLWLGGTALAMWQYEYRYILPKTAKPGLAVDSAVAQLLSKDFSLGKPTLLHFWNPDCPCSWDTNEELKRIAEQHPSQRLEIITFIQARKGDESRALAQWEKAKLPGRPIVDVNCDVAHKFGVAATPGAILISDKGEVLYQGSYNISRFCKDDKTAYASIAITAALSDSPIQHPKMPYYGCALPVKP